jgi:hypothetical protein
MVKVLGRHRRRWRDIFEIKFKKVGCDDMDWIYLPEGNDQWWALVNAVMNFRVR